MNQSNTAPPPATVQLATSYQQIVLCTGFGRFMAEVNEHLLNGWRVVPGTFSCTTARVLASPKDPPQFIDAEGCCWRQTLFVVLESPRESHQCA